MKNIADFLPMAFRLFAHRDFMPNKHNCSTTANETYYQGCGSFITLTGGVIL
jgi:hypothetical protein